MGHGALVLSFPAGRCANDYAQEPRLVLSVVEVSRSMGHETNDK
ncbi:hypothetical protein [Nostoc sp. CHAB 5715]|nr:hypothetical protein [Nostoc sp. CHAB 5715]